MKIIRDLTHGYISINEKDIFFIDTPIFQRLKRIRQTTAHAAYPNATHTRFEHSLGVMHLGVLIYKLLKKDHTAFGEEKLKTTIRYACLLHDVGHAPFSHALEHLFNDIECKDLLKAYGLSFDVDRETSAPHERMSCLIALKFFEEKFKELKIDIDLFCRMILGIEYEIGTPKSELNPLINLLNSYIDVDKLDYLMRDNIMTGVHMVSLDKERIIKSYTVHNNRLVLSSKALSVVSNLIYGRNAMYLWVYNHHIVSYYTSLIQRYIQYLINVNPNVKKNYFSFEAIHKDLIDDYDIINLFKSQKDYDKHTKSLYNQIFNREYLKPLWKTPFEFDNVLEPDQQDKISVAAKINLEDDLRSKLSLDPDDLYVIMAEFKPFNPSDSSQIYVLIENETKRFTDLFEPRTTSKAFKEIPYIFTNDSKKDIVLEYLKNI